MPAPAPYTPGSPVGPLAPPTQAEIAADTAESAQQVLNKQMQWIVGGGVGDPPATPAEVTAAESVLTRKQATAPQAIVHGDNIVWYDPTTMKVISTAPLPAAGTKPPDQFVLGKDGNYYQLTVGADGNPIAKPVAGGPPATTHAAAPGSISPGEFVWSDTGGTDGKGGYVEGAPPKPTTTTVSPGQGLVKPDGTVTVPVAAPPTTLAPGHTLVGPDGKPIYTAPDPTAQTPAAAHAARLSEIDRTATDAANTQIAVIQARIAAGLDVSPAELEKLKADLAETAAQANAQRTQAQAEFQHGLDQPNVDRAAGISQQTADTASASQQSNAAFQRAQTDQAQVNQQSDVLKTQAQAGSDFINQGIKLGVTSSMGSIHMALDPLMAALQLTHKAIQSGTLPPTAMPTPNPATPAAPPPGAPAPAPTPPQVGAPPPAPYVNGAM